MSRKQAVRAVLAKHRALSECGGPVANLKVKQARHRRLWIIGGFCTGCQCELFYEVGYPIRNR